MAALGLQVDNTLGAAFVGFSISCVVYGLMTAQVYTYFRRYPNDRYCYKFLAAGLWILETLDQCLIGHVVYYYSIKNYLNPAALIIDRPIWTLIIQVTVGAIVGAVVKSAFAIRVWRFSKYNYLLAGILLSLTFAQLALATAYTVKGFQTKNLVLDLPSQKTIASLALGAGVVTDTSTAVALCYYLQKLRTGYSSSDTIVTTLTRYAVNCGVLTSAFSLVTLITYDALPGTFVTMAFYFVMSKLYTVSFMATLNTRTTIRGRGTDHEHSHFRNTFYMYGQSTTSPTQVTDLPLSPDELRVKVDVHQEVTVKSEAPYYASQ
jgi:hypothetical protein